MTATDTALTDHELAAASGRSREGDPISPEYAYAAVSAESLRRRTLLARIPTWHDTDDLFV